MGEACERGEEAVTMMQKSIEGDMFSYSEILENKRKYHYRRRLSYPV